MSAIPDPDDDEFQDWDDQWDEWSALDLIERQERANQQWWQWAGRLAAVALLLPIVLGLLVAFLIWVF